MASMCLPRNTCYPFLCDNNLEHVCTDTNSETIKLYQHANRPYSHYTKEGDSQHYVVQRYSICC